MRWGAAAVFPGGLRSVLLRRRRAREGVRLSTQMESAGGRVLLEPRKKQIVLGIILLVLGLGGLGLGWLFYFQAPREILDTFNSRPDLAIQLAFDDGAQMSIQNGLMAARRWGIVAFVLGGIFTLAGVIRLATLAPDFSTVQNQLAMLDGIRGRGGRSDERDLPNADRMGVCGCCGQKFVETTRVWPPQGHQWKGPLEPFETAGACPKCRADYGLVAGFERAFGVSVEPVLEGDARKQTALATVKSARDADELQALIAQLRATGMDAVVKVAEERLARAGREADEISKLRGTAAQAILARQVKQVAQLARVTVQEAPEGSAFPKGWDALLKELEARQHELAEREQRHRNSHACQACGGRLSRYEAAAGLCGGCSQTARKFDAQCIQRGGGAG